MAKTITVQGLTFERNVAVGRFCDDGVYYEYADPDTGIKWTVFRPPCPEYCTPYWTCHVELMTYQRGILPKAMTSCTELGDGKVMIGPLYHDVPHGDEDPPMQLLEAVADMIHQGIDPFGEGTQPWRAPQIPCPVEIGTEVYWQGRVWKVEGREWRGRWLLTLVWPRNGGIVYDVPAHQVGVATTDEQPPEPRTPTTGTQLNLI